MNERTEVDVRWDARARGAAAGAPDVPSAAAGTGRRVALATFSFAVCFATWGTNSALSAGSGRQVVHHRVRVMIDPAEAGAKTHNVKWEPSDKLTVYNGDTITWLFINRSGTDLKAGVDNFRWNKQFGTDHRRKNPFVEQAFPLAEKVLNKDAECVTATVWLDPSAFFDEKGEPVLGLSFKYDIVDVAGSAKVVLLDPEIEVRP